MELISIEDRENTLYSTGKSLGSRPWDGMVISQNENCLYFCPNEVFVIGKDFDGVVAATRRLVNARDRFLVPNLKAKESLIEDKDVLGISVFDLMHNEENRDDYRDNTQQFGDVVEDVLNDNNFEVAIKTVRTYNDNTTLRLKNVNSDFSKNYKDVINGNRTPVVFSGGLFSNLFRWEENEGLAVKIAQLGRDVWEIEMTGGPTTECDTCPNYKYEDLVDYYWPALIAGVEKYSSQSKIDYVGHSNGCRVALDSLKNWSSSGKNNAGYYFDAETGQYLLSDLSSNPVDTFIGLGCPGALNGTSKTIEKAIQEGANALLLFENNNQSHISGREFAAGLRLPFSGVWPKDVNSLNLTRYYYNLAISDSDHQPGAGLSISKVYLIAGNKAPPLYDPKTGNDGLVPLEDMLSINKSINRTQGELKIFDVSHSNLIDENKIHKYIKNILGG